ncbi:MAG: hypothetical protein WC599_05450 [Bacteroidales bacterium]
MFKRLRYLRWYYWGRWWIKNRIHQKARRGEKIKIIIGSSKDFLEKDGWIYTNLPHFNILKESDWKYFFSKTRINNLLAEHVLEHLTEKEVEKVLKLSFQYLKAGGVFRIAVPDGLNPDPDYIDMVSPTGKIGSFHGHKFLWNYQSLEKLANNNGWSAMFLEYYNEDGNFISNDFTFDNGPIERSSKNNSANSELSLIIDCLKN